MAYDVICFGCGERGAIDKLGSRVVHSCGSADVDLWTGEQDQLSRVAALRGDGPSFVDFMRQAARQPGMPPPPNAEKEYPGEVGNDPVAGWDEYEGGMPGPNPMAVPQHTELMDEKRAPVRPVPGEEETQPSNAYVYNKRQPNDAPTTPPSAPYVAPHEYDLGQKVTKIPFLGRRKSTAPVELSAPCPRCGARGTQLVADSREHAHWACHVRCGSLADLDARPGVDPYRPVGADWGGDRFHQGRTAARAKDGQILRRMAVIGKTNPGLSLSEVLGLARQSVNQHPEA